MHDPWQVCSEWLCLNPENKNDLSISVLSWNLHGLPWPITRNRAARFDAVGHRLREENFDLILLQEVWSTSYADQLDHHLSDRYERVSESGARGPKGGLAAYIKRSRARSSAARFYKFSANAPRWKLWEGDGIAGKGFLVFDLEIDAAMRLRVVNTHLQSRYPGRDYYAVRESQITQLTHRISELDDATPTLVAGDFNTVPDGKLYDAITSIGRELTADLRHGGIRGTQLERDGPRDWIDYILMRAGANCSCECHMIVNLAADNPYSDHEAVVADIIFSTPSNIGATQLQHIDDGG